MFGVIERIPVWLVSEQRYPVVDSAHKEDEDGLALGLLKFFDLAVDAQNVICAVLDLAECILKELNPNFGAFFVVPQVVQLGVFEDEVLHVNTLKRSL